MRTARSEVVEPYRRERFFDAPIALGLRNAAHAQPVGNVLRDAHVREERVVLEHRVDVAVEWGQPGNVAPLQHHGSVARELEARDHPQHRGLAGTGRTQHREELALGDVEIHTRDGGDVTEALDHAS